MKISDFPKDIIKKNVKETVEGIEHIIKTCGPRESGCEGCFKSQEEIVKFLGDAVDESHYEGYTVAPKAFFSFTKVVSIAVMAAGIVSFALFFANIITYLTLNIIFGAVVGVGLFITVMEFLLYKQFCDPFCKKVEGHTTLLPQERHRVKPSAELLSAATVTPFMNGAICITSAARVRRLCWLLLLQGQSQAL